MPKKILLASVLLISAALIVPNARSLHEGIFFYLRDAITYSPSNVKPITPNGRYGSIYDLVRMRNAQRYEYLLQHLDLPGVTVTPIAIPNSPFSNLFVRFDKSQPPHTIFSAHYDKLHDNINYQGASDNTAAVSVLLTAITQLAQSGDGGNRAFLFTGEEETGLRGAQAFVNYARANDIAIREIINFDNIGRSELAIRPEAGIPGFVFTLPFVINLSYDGHTFRPTPPYSPVKVGLTQSLLRVQPDMIVYERFTGLTDSSVFQANGIDTVALSSANMYYLEQTWHSNADRVELLDEQSLDRAYELILATR